MNPDWQEAGEKIAGIPRVSGDEPVPDWIPEIGGKYSPRERG